MLLPVLGLLLLQAATFPADARIRPFVEPKPMQITITGTQSAPQALTVQQSGSTFLASAATSGVLLPVAAGGAQLLALEYHFVVLSGADLTVFPFGGDVITVGTASSGSGTAGGYLLADEVQTFTVRAGSTGWAVSGSGVIGVGDSLSTPETRVYRSAFRGTIQTAILPASTLNVGSASSAPTSNALGWSFANGATNDLGGLTFVMPSDWTAGSDIKLFLHYIKTTSAAGTVKWQERHRITNGSYVLAAWSSWADFDTTVVSDSDTADKQAIVSFPALSMSLAGNPVYGRAVAFDVRRVSSGGSADTYGAAAVLLALGVHYNSDTPGWRTSFTK